MSWNTKQATKSDALRRGTKIGLIILAIYVFYVFLGVPAIDMVAKTLR